MRWSLRGVNSKDAPPVQLKSSSMWPRSYSGFVTAAGDILSSEDYDSLIHDRRKVFVVGKITYADDFGSHEDDVCEAIQPQIALPPDIVPNKISVQVIWGGCSIFSGEK
jgi:hypothetical protein